MRGPSHTPRAREPNVTVLAYGFVLFRKDQFPLLVIGSGRMSVHRVCARCPWGQEEGTGSSGTAVTTKCSKVNLGPLEEQQTLLTAKPFLSPKTFKKKKKAFQENQMKSGF